MTANQLFKNVYDSITRKIEAVHPEAYQAFGRLARQVSRSARSL